MTEVPGGRDDEAARHVVPAVEPVDLVARRGLDRVGGAEDGPAERMVRPERLGEEVVDDLLGRVLVHVDLLEDHLPLRVEVGGSEPRVLEHVGEVVDGQLQVAVEDPRVVAVYSFEVNAFRSPPTASNASAMSRADLVCVPLKSRCSRKWLEPLIAGGSSREPARTQKPRDTERTPGIRSVTTRRPEENSVRSIPTSASGSFGYAEEPFSASSRNRRP